MGMLFDSVGITAQASSAAAGRLDSTNDLAGGGAGQRGGVNQTFAFGQGNRVDASGQATGGQSIPWLWIAGGLAALWLTFKLFKKKGGA